ncbi:hypothetical protein D3C76_1868880 [compost metagenome]
MKLAKRSTGVARNSWGTKTPLIKAGPKAATLAMALIALRLLTRLPIRKLALARQRVKTREFSSR